MARATNVPASTYPDLLSERGQLNGGEMNYVPIPIRYTQTDWRKYCAMRKEQEQINRNVVQDFRYLEHPFNIEGWDL